MDKVKQESRRSYGQFCGLARALDVVGDRWNLLVVRELLPGPLRYSQLKASLAGIATNLLAERLRSLEANGIVERRLADASVVYTLTPWGVGLREPIEAFLHWSVPLMAVGRNGDAFQPRWLAVALPALLRGVTADPAVELGIEVDDFRLVLRVDERGPRVVTEADRMPETVLAAAPDAVIGLAAGALTVEEILSIGELHGDERVLRAVLPPRPKVAGRSTASGPGERGCADRRPDQAGA